MVKRAFSENVKALQKRKKADDALRAAITKYHIYAATPKEEHPKGGGKAIADKHSIKYRTLMNHIEGRSAKTIGEHNAAHTKLSHAEERLLIDLIKDSADQGFPLDHDNIKKYANILLLAKYGANYEEVGKQWVFNFLDCHHDELQAHWSKPLDMQRGKALNPEAVKRWFELVKKFVHDAGIDPDCIYGMDESRFPSANQGKTRVIGARGTKTQHKQGGGDRENVTVLVTICADGTTVKPLIIFKGKNITNRMVQNNVAGAAYVTIPILNDQVLRNLAESQQQRTDGQMAGEHSNGLRKSSNLKRAQRQMVVHVSCFWMGTSRTTHWKLSDLQSNTT